MATVRSPGKNPELSKYRGFERWNGGAKQRVAFLVGGGRTKVDCGVLWNASGSLETSPRNETILVLLKFVTQG